MTRKYKTYLVTASSPARPLAGSGVGQGVGGATLTNASGSRPLAGSGIGKGVAGGNLGVSGSGGFSADGSYWLDGTIADGNTVTINGSGFGTKPTAKPFLWAPMDGSINPSSLGVVTAWNATENVAYNASEGITGGGVMKGAIKGGGGGETIWTARVDASGFAWSDYGQKMYLFRRTKKNWEWTSQFNWKTFRTWPADANGTQPNFFMSTDGIAVSAPISAGGYVFAEGVKEEIWGPADVWLNEEILVQSNSANGTRDGSFYYYVNGVLKGDATPGENMFGLKDTGSQPIEVVYPVHGVEATDANSGVVPAGGTYWADDVYLDRTWARVMIGNASTWGASTVREICIPTAWSDTAVGVVLRAGVHGSLVGKYLYLITDAGTVNRIGQFT
jgi:hypothetical protein